MQQQAWQSGDRATAAVEFEHHVPFATVTLDRVQRLPASMAGNGPGETSVPIPKSGPRGQGEPSAPNAPPGTDLTQLANSVYNLLVRRLFSERQRRGL